MSLYGKSFLCLNQMKKIAEILMLIGFAVVCASQVEIELALKNSNGTIRVIVPEGAFQMIDNQKILASLNTKNGISISEEKPAEKYIPVAQCEFESKSEYEQFRKLWDIDSSALSTKDSTPAQEQTSHTADLSKDLFEKYFLTANYLDIQGDYAKRFFKNMVKYGLFGKHSADIMASRVFSTHYLFYDTFWNLLYAFLDETGFNYRDAYPSAGQTMLLIESTNVRPKKINKEYTGPPQATTMRTVLHSRLGPAGSPEKERNETVLAWLLLNIGGSSVDIQYSTDITSEGSSDLSQTIKQFTKEKKKDVGMHVEGLTLKVDCIKGSFSLLPALQLVPDLSRLELFITSSCIIPNASLSSLFSSISLCRSLKTLKTTGQILESVVVSSLAENLPDIEELSIRCKPLEDTAIDSLKKCPQLGKLKIEGERQPSAVVQALVKNLPYLRELSIECTSLDTAAAESFKKCTRLESLELNGELQPNTAVQALLALLPSLKELSIVYNVLAPADAEYFKTCTRLENLGILGEGNASSLIKLLEVLPSLQELIIKIDTADFALADALRKCSTLRSLTLTVDQYTPGFLARYLQTPLPKMKSLELWKFDSNTNRSEEDNRAVKEARAKEMSIYLKDF
ncbi:hypothetical protein NECID01_1489 [Nematocida sp. AWRm77]|nr:hypothetical protein NECID01_1489 [Nematocida sp. AWRm77]